jgi:subtilisin family serine protease
LRIRELAAVTVAVALLVGCGGGGGGSSVPSGAGTPIPSSGSATIGSSGGSVTVASGGTTATFSFPPASPSGSVSVSAGATPSANVQSTLRKPQSASGVLYFSLSSSTPLTFNNFPTITIVGTTVTGIAVYDSSTGYWNYTDYSGSGTTFTSGVTFTLGPANSPMFFALYTGTPSQPESSVAYTCPNSYTVASAARGLAGSSEGAIRKLPQHAVKTTILSGRIAVVYDRNSFQRSAASFTRNEQNAGGTLVKSFDYPSIGKTVHVLAVPAAQMTVAMAALHSQSGVLAVAPTQRRYALRVTNPVFANNSYFKSFTPPNTTVAPYYETASIPGQWDMHVIGMEDVYGYVSSANVNNGSGPSSSLVLENPGIKLAIIDTGADATHPALGANGAGAHGGEPNGNIVYQKCFITDPNGNLSTGSYATDPMGHGTDVAGIAAGITNPATTFGFAAAGGNTSVMAYRVFPTPDDNCASNNSANDPQCGADTADIASAIDDAVAQGAKIISMSLGGGSCGNNKNPGGDSDPTEGAAVENAITSGVVVIAASGNEYASSVDAPGCDSGVIAVGATSLDDGQPNGSKHTGSGEYVASYSNAGSPNNLRDPSSWGIVAPGGDPAGNSDPDKLHWIENIWTSTPFAAYPGDPNFAGECTDDFPNSKSTTPPVDCRILIAGTSMATPHVAGVAAIVCGIKPTDCTPTNMKNLLCTYAHDLGDPRQGCGRLNAYAVIAHELNDGAPPSP